jgi:hypothetical protein
MDEVIPLVLTRMPEPLSALPQPQGQATHREEKPATAQ